MCSPRANFPCPMGTGHQAWARISRLVDPAPRRIGVATARPSECPSAGTRVRGHRHPVLDVGRGGPVARQAGSWDESQQTVTTTICPYCGVGCNLELHVQDNRIVKVTSPLDHDVSHGHLCVKGRFGFEFVQRRARES